MQAVQNIGDQPLLGTNPN